jgi:hypothetical protein
VESREPIVLVTTQQLFIDIPSYYMVALAHRKNSNNINGSVNWVDMAQ